MHLPLSPKAAELYDKINGFQNYSVLESDLLYSVSLSTASKTIAIKTNVNWIIESVKSRYLVNDKKDADDTLIVFKQDDETYVVRTDRTVTLIHLETGNKFFFSSLDLERFNTVAGSLSDLDSNIPNKTFITYLDNQLINLILQQVKQCFLLHANILIKDAKLILLVGKSGVGKTTTSLRLKEHGFSFFTDDLVFFDTQNYMLYSGPKKAKTEEAVLYPLAQPYPADLQNIKPVVFFLERDYAAGTRSITNINVGDALSHFMGAAYYLSEFNLFQLHQFSCRFLSSGISFLVRYSNPTSLEDDIVNTIEKC